MSLTASKDKYLQLCKVHGFLFHFLGKIMQFVNMCIINSVLNPNFRTHSRSIKIPIIIWFSKIYGPFKKDRYSLHFKIRLNKFYCIIYCIQTRTIYCMQHGHEKMFSVNALVSWGITFSPLAYIYTLLVNPLCWVNKPRWWEAIVCWLTS